MVRGSVLECSQRIPGGWYQNYAYLIRASCPGNTCGYICITKGKGLGGSINRGRISIASVLNLVRVKLPITTLKRSITPKLVA